MTSLKQIDANRLNARKSTGPRTVQGKQRSRCNALRHGLTAEMVIDALECAADYRAFEASILAEHNPRTTTERELASRLASVLWRLRRSTSIETGLFQIEAELMRDADTAIMRRRAEGRTEHKACRSRLARRQPRQPRHPHRQGRPLACVHRQNLLARSQPQR